MKRNIAIILALVLMMTVVFFGCGKKEEAEEASKDETSQQAEGTENTTAGVPSSDNTDVTEATDATEATDPTDVTGATDPTDATSATDPTDITKPSKNELTPSKPNEGTQQLPPLESYIKGSNLEKYAEIFSSGTYSMTVTSVLDGTEDVPILLACKNGNMRMDISMEGIPATMIYIAENDTVYLLFELIGKLYTELTEEVMGDDFDFSDATESFVIPDNGTLTKGTGKLDGKTVVTETLVTENKTSVFYFDGNGNLLGIGNKSGSTEDITKISGLSTDVDDSVFEIPSDYKYVDMAWLMNMA